MSFQYPPTALAENATPLARQPQVDQPTQSHPFRSAANVVAAIGLALLGGFFGIVFGTVIALASGLIELC